MHRDAVLPPHASESLAVGLGWFSLALGAAELAAPEHVARLIGVTPTERRMATLRSYGAREVGSGLAILVQPHRSTWLWSRVAGDLLDLATLGTAMTSPATDRRRAVLATAAVLGVTALDVLCAQQLRHQEQEDDQTLSDRRPALGSAAMRRKGSRVRVHEAMTINAPIERVEERWANLESMPESLRTLNQQTDGPDERAIVEFRQAPGGRGTEVRIEIEYTPRAGALGAQLARLVGGDPAGQVREDLRRFKQLVETGEVVLSEGPALWRPARPAEHPQEIRQAAGVGV
jgi:hypothetical protein